MQSPKLSNDQHRRVNIPQALVVLTGFHITFMVSLFLCKKRESLDRAYNKQKKYSFLLSSRLYYTRSFIENKKKHKDSFPVVFLREKTVNFSTAL